MAKTIGKISLGVLIALSVIFIALNIYAQVFMKDVTYGINYIEDQNGVDIVESDKLTEEEKTNTKNVGSWRQVIIQTIKIME